MEEQVRNNVRFDVFCLNPTQKCSYTVTDIVYQDTLENFHADCSRYAVPDE